MITIKAGKLFCEKYNEEKGTQLTPKEIFCNVIAPIAWKDNDMVCFDVNDAFHHPKRKSKKYEDELLNFCKDVETDADNFGLMTSKRVFGGCACQAYEEMSSTYAMIGDDMYFDVNERYCSFIGAVFMIRIGRYSVSILNKKIIWDLFESMLAYRDALNTNDAVKTQRLLLNWNGRYLFRKYIYGDDKVNLTDVFDNVDGKITCIGIAELMLIVSKLDKMPSYIEIESVGNTNVSCGAVLLNNTVFKYLKDFYCNVIGTKVQFDWKKFNNAYDSDGHKVSTHILTEILKNGTVDCNIDRYIMRNLVLNIKPFDYKNLESIMKKEDIEKAKELGKLIAECDNAAKNVSLKKQIEDVLSSKTPRQFCRNVISMCEYAKYDHTKFLPIVDYIMNREETEKWVVSDITLYTKFLVEQ